MNLIRILSYEYVKATLGFLAIAGGLIGSISICGVNLNVKPLGIRAIYSYYDSERNGETDTIEKMTPIWKCQGYQFENPIIVGWNKEIFKRGEKEFEDYIKTISR